MDAREQAPPFPCRCEPVFPQGTRRYPIQYTEKAQQSNRHFRMLQKTAPKLHEAAALRPVLNRDHHLRLFFDHLQGKH